MAKRQYSFSEDTFSHFRSQHIQVKVANTNWEKKGYYDLRRAVFAREQKILPDNERDSQDFRATGIVALASTWGVMDEVVGAVRIYQDTSLPGNVWFGGRLCVNRAYRGHKSIGKALINEAVSRAIDLGCKQFLANVQPQNEHYFKSVHWSTIGSIDIANKPHVRMEAQLNCYPFMPRCPA